MFPRGGNARRFPSGSGIALADSLAETAAFGKPIGTGELSFVRIGIDFGTK